MAAKLSFISCGNHGSVMRDDEAKVVTNRQLKK
jgi:hypothetical protein